VAESQGQTSSFEFSLPPLLRLYGTFDTTSTGAAPSGSLKQNVMGDA
jgi:hypothetical protein